MITNHTPFNILLIEDDEVDIENVERLIKQSNTPIQLQIARNGTEALDKLYGRNNIKKLDPLPNLIFLDINMPKINGLEFLKILRNDPMFKKIYVVILSHSNNDTDRTTALNLKIDEYLVKPLQFDKFDRICNKSLYFT